VIRETDLGLTSQEEYRLLLLYSGMPVACCAEAFLVSATVTMLS